MWRGLYTAKRTMCRSLQRVQATQLATRVWSRRLLFRDSFNVLLQLALLLWGRRQGQRNAGGSTEAAGLQRSGTVVPGTQQFLHPTWSPCRQRIGVLFQLQARLWHFQPRLAAGSVWPERMETTCMVYGLLMLQSFVPCSCRHLRWVNPQSKGRPSILLTGLHIPPSQTSSIYEHALPAVFSCFLKQHGMHAHA
jgi:hypothetical protein